jgi:hypothetical protein
MDGTRCFLLEPVFRANNVLQFTPRAWDARLIVGWLNPATKLILESPEEHGLGAVLRAIWYPRNFTWINELNPHLQVVLGPTGIWDLDSRARNCCHPRDSIHRCWTWTGEPPNITVTDEGECGQMLVYNKKSYGIINGAFKELESE